MREKYSTKSPSHHLNIITFTPTISQTTNVFYNKLKQYNHLVVTLPKQRWRTDFSEVRREKQYKKRVSPRIQRNRVGGQHNNGIRWSGEKTNVYDTFRPSTKLYLQFLRIWKPHTDQPTQLYISTKSQR